MEIWKKSSKFKSFAEKFMLKPNFENYTFCEKVLIFRTNIISNDCLCSSCPILWYWGSNFWTLLENLFWTLGVGIVSVYDCNEGKEGMFKVQQ